MTTRKTRSGLFIREDELLGLLIFSPFTGQMYAVAGEYADPVVQWLDDSKALPEDADVIAALGAGWHLSRENAVARIPHLLPAKQYFDVSPQPSHPILINWFITGLCPLGCLYCYAEDMMRRRLPEPNQSAIEAIGEEILKVGPVAVVLTGGDPLFGPNLEPALDTIGGKTGVIIDTSGYTLNEKHIKLFRKHCVVIRISLDAERPQVHDFQRPLYAGYPQLKNKRPSTAEAALSAVCRCLDAGLTVTVQTVATKKNVNDLPSLGQKLEKIGVHSWRVFKVAPSEAKRTEYAALIGGKPGQKYAKNTGGAYDYVFRQLLREFGAGPGRMGLQVTANEKPNAVILVGPDGVFRTESDTDIRKIIIDEASPMAPSIDAIRSRVDLFAHASRYLNNTSSKYINK